MLITIDTEKSSPEEIRKAVRILLALEDSTEGLRSTIRMLYDILAEKVNEKRRRYRKLFQKRRRASSLKQEANKGEHSGMAKGGGMFQGVELGY